MPTRPRTQTQDLAGTPTVAPVASYRDGSFLVRPAKRQIDSNSFSSLSARFAKLATDAKITEDDKQFQLGAAEVAELESTAAADHSTSQKALATAIREGRLEEQYSPAYAIAARRQSGRGAQARANALIEERIDELQSTGLANAEAGIPSSIPSLEDIQREVHDAVFGEYGDVNPGMADDFYFKSEYANGQAAAAPQLESYYRKVVGAVDKQITRTEFGNQVQTAVTGAAGLEGKELSDYLKMAEGGLRTMLVDSGLKDPHAFVVENFGLAINGVLRNGPDKLANADRAADLAAAFDGLPVGTSTLGKSEKFREIWGRIENHRRLAEQDEKSRAYEKVQLDVQEARNDPDGLWARALSQTPAENEAMIDDLRGLVADPEALSAATGSESSVAVLGELIAFNANLNRTDSGRTQAGIEKLLNNADVEAARDQVQYLPVELQDQYTDRINSWEEVQIGKFRSSPRFSTASKDLTASADSLTGIGATHGALVAVREFAAGEESAWTERVQEALAGAPEDKHAAILSDAFGPWMRESKTRVDAMVTKAREDRSRIGDSAEELTRSLDSAGLTKMLNQSDLSAGEREVFQSQFTRISKNNVAAVNSAGWASLDAQITQQFMAPGFALSGAVLNPARLDQIGAAASLSPDGLRARQEITDDVRVRLDEWLQTDEGFAARDDTVLGFGNSVTKKIKEFGDAEIAKRVQEFQGAEAAEDREDTLETREGAGDAEAPYSQYVAQRQLEEGGMSVSAAVYDKPDWVAFAASGAGIDVRQDTFRDAVSESFVALVGSGRGFTEVVRTNAHLGEVVESLHLSQKLPGIYPTAGMAARAASLSSTVTGAPFTSSELLEDVMSEAGGFDILAASLSLRVQSTTESIQAGGGTFGSVLARADRDNWRTAWNPRPVRSFIEQAIQDVPVRDLLASTILTASTDAKESIAANEDASDADKLHAMVALSELTGVTTSELLAGAFANGVSITDPKVLDYGRVPHGFASSSELAKFMKSGNLAPVMELFDLDAGSQDDRIKYELAQIRLLY